MLRLVLTVPGARSLKDRRRPVRALLDRIRHRFEVSVAELPDDATHSRQTVVVSMIGNERRHVADVLDRIRLFAEGGRDAWPIAVDVDVFRWHPVDDWRGRDLILSEDEDDG